MQALSSLLTRPLHVIDVGARAGIHPRWEKLRRQVRMRITGFEADAQECAALNERAPEGVKYLPYALWSRSGECVLHLLAASGSSSLYRPDLNFIGRTRLGSAYSILREIPLPALSLDEALQREAAGEIDFIKIDTEGAELEILRGAQRTLENIFAAELEVWFHPVFEKMPVFREVDAFMAAQGFTLLDLARCNCFFKRSEGAALGGPKGQLVAGDALYIRDLAALPPESPFFQKEKLVRNLILLMQYGYYDMALEFAGLARRHGTVGENDYAILRRCIHSEGRRSMFDFPGKRTLEKISKRISRWLTKQEGDYLGNW